MTLDLRTFTRKVCGTDGVYGTVLQTKGLLNPRECAELPLMFHFQRARRLEKNL